MDIHMQYILSIMHPVRALLCPVAFSAEVDFIHIRQGYFNEMIDTMAMWQPWIWINGPYESTIPLKRNTKNQIKIIIVRVFHDLYLLNIYSLDTELD